MNITYPRTLVLSFILLCATVIHGAAAGKPEITHYTAQYLNRALSVNIEWQSENPVTKVRVTAGNGQKEIIVDEYDNRRNPYGYSGEASVVVPIDPSLFQENVSYQIQLEDDLRQRSELFSGKTKLPSMSSPIIAAPPGMYGMPGAGHDDNWGKENIRAGKGQGESRDGASNDMIDKMLVVADRFDMPPSLEPIKVHVLGPENVSFSSKAQDDKGLKEITFRLYDGVGNKVGEQTLQNLGKKWEGSTQPIKVTSGGTFRVVAQAVDTAGNTSQEQVASFHMTGAAPVPVPVSGVCGTANSQKADAAPVADLCGKGTATAVTGAGPWGWSCLGTDGGTAAQCSADKKLEPLHGACGTSHAIRVTAKPIAPQDLCSSGMASSVTGNNPFDWSCAGSNGGTSAVCKTTAPPQTYTITATAGQGGGITPASQIIEQGNTVTFTVTPQTGYETKSVSGCSGTLSGNSFTTGAIIGACEVAAVFALLPPNSFPVTVEPITCATVTPTQQTVEAGKSATFSFVPAAGSKVASASGCKGTLSGTVYTTGSITEACTVTATCSGIIGTGTCGSANNQSLSQEPTGAALCTQSESSAVISATDGWKWSCAGKNNGSLEQCSARKKVDAVCGQEKNSCTPGAAVLLSETTEKFLWTCNGLNGGNNAACTEQKPPVDGECGIFTTMKVQYPPVIDIKDKTLLITFCAKGAPQSSTIRYVRAPDVFDWDCVGLNNGKTAHCQVPIPKKGTCSSLSGTSSRTAPETGLCSEGTPTSVKDSGNAWVWVCQGINMGPESETCSVTKLVDTCGPAADLPNLIAPTIGLCSAGSQAGQVIDAGIKWSWKCGTVECSTQKCTAGLLSCNGQCVNLGTNSNCSTCGDICSGGKTCNGNGCVCPTGSIEENGVCKTVYTVTASGSGTGGSITPPSQKVTTGSTGVVFISTQQNYKADVTGCGINLKDVTTGSYPTGIIKADCTVQAIFKDAAINGACGNMTGGQAHPIEPTGALCSSSGGFTMGPHTPSEWKWSCSGVNNGTPAPCSKPKSQFDVRVSKTGNGSGTVSTIDGTISCGSVCSSSYYVGTLVSLSASTTDPTINFVKWSGCDNSKSTTCNVTVNSTKNITAEFVKKTALVTATATGGGSISPASQTVNVGVKTPLIISKPNDYTVTVSGCGATLNGTTVTTGPVPEGGCSVLATFTAPIVNGACNTTYANSQPSLTEPVGNVCSTGTQTRPQAIASDWAWNCNGERGGSNVQCKKPKQDNGVCSQLKGSCTMGKSSPVTEVVGKANWTCSGINGGKEDACSITIPVPGACGATKGSCSSPGNASPVVESNGVASWTCYGLNSGINGTCSITIPLDGVCGSAESSATYVAPTTNLCGPGSASPVTKSGNEWNWKCNGKNGGVNSRVCKHLVKTDGKCGTANGLSFSQKPYYNLCLPGDNKASAVSTSNVSWAWNCSGENGGTVASCSSPTVNPTCSYTTPNVCSSSGIALWPTSNQSSRSANVSSPRTQLSFNIQNGGKVAWSNYKFVVRSVDGNVCIDPGNGSKQPEFSASGSNTTVAHLDIDTPKKPGTYYVTLDIVDTRQNCRLKSPATTLDGRKIDGPVGFNLIVK